MIGVNKLLIKRIFTRVIISFVLCILVILITGSIADSMGYSGVIPFQAASQRTDFVKSIFMFLPSYGNLLLSVLLVSILSSTLIFTSIKNYINKRNLLDWNLILYLPTLLIYASLPSKESLFFIPALLYIILESEFILNNKNNSFIFAFKISILYFLHLVRGPLSLPYIFLAILIFLFKIFDFNFLIIKKLNLAKLLIYSFVISLIVLMIVDSDLIVYNLELLNKNFDTESILTRRYDLSLINNIYNPLSLIKIQYLSLFPSIYETINKPYSILIIYESIMFLYLFFKTWNNLFLLLERDNKAKLTFAMIFIIITSSYFLTYGLVGYINVGSSQRFRSNFIPISLILPLISGILVRKKLNKST